MEIPAWPVTRSLELRDKPFFDALFAELQPHVSELCFAGLYLFRKAHDYKVTRIGRSVVITGKGYDGSEYFLPPLGGDPAAALKELFGAGLPLYGADQAFIARLQPGKNMEIVEDRDSCDYLYLRDVLATLPGNLFHKKRNRINYFTSRHLYETVRYDQHHQTDCQALLDIWSQIARREGNPSLAFEVEAASDALSLRAELELEGVVITVGHTVKAFALGERLNRETSVCHFEKTDPFMEGLPQLINREFSRLLFNDCRFVNREQDLGEPGLRTAKLSYHPAQLISKYRVFPKTK